MINIKLFLILLFVSCRDDDDDVDVVARCYFSVEKLSMIFYSLCISAYSLFLVYNNPQSDNDDDESKSKGEIERVRVPTLEHQ